MLQTRGVFLSRQWDTAVERGAFEDVCVWPGTSSQLWEAPALQKCIKVSSKKDRDTETSTTKAHSRGNNASSLMINTLFGNYQEASKFKSKNKDYESILKTEATDLF